MSQTLSIDVFKNKSQLDEQGVPLVSIWFKWAGYSTQTLRELQELWKWISKRNLKSVSDEEAKLSIIRYAESKGGGVDDEDLDYVQDHYENEEFSSPQSNGYLTALSFDAQEAMHDAAGYAYIIMETDTVYTDVCDIIQDYEDYAEWYGEEYGEEPPTEEEIPVLEIANLEGEFPAQELDEAIKQLESLNNNNDGIYTFKYPDGRIVELLE